MKKRSEVEMVVTALVWVFFGIPMLLLWLLGIYKGGKK